MLAEAYTNYNDELRADFQQFYNLNLDGLGKDYSIDHAAVLTKQLPHGSRVMEAALARYTQIKEQQKEEKSEGFTADEYEQLLKRRRHG